MATSTPLLSVLDYQPVDFSFVPNEKFRPNEPLHAQIHTSFNVHQYEDDPRRFAILLQCRLFQSADDENISYTVNFTLLGEFFSTAQLSNAGVPARVVNNAIVILYGIARGIVGQATAGGVHGRFVLPAIVFSELVEQSALRSAETKVLPDETTPRATGSVPHSSQAKPSVDDERAPSGRLRRVAGPPAKKK